MIQTAMLIILGFLLATLISLLLAPIVWRRAARLANKNLKSELPISLTDFYAEKDQLRADHAISQRKLEQELDVAKEKTAEQMVEIGRQSAENMSQSTRIRELRSALSERKSLIAVMEQTLNANVPRMKERLEDEIGAKIQLTDTVGELQGTLKKTTHQLEEADRNIKVRDAEILKLRRAVDIRPQVGAALTPKRGFKGKVIAAGELDLASLDLKAGGKEARVLEELQSENLQLREVISQTKEQLQKAKSFEAKEVPLLRQEIRQLGTEVLRSAQVQKVEKPASGVAKKLPKLAEVAGKGAKRSLAERLKGVPKMSSQVDA